MDQNYITIRKKNDECIIFYIKIFATLVRKHLEEHSQTIFSEIRRYDNDEA